MVRSTLPARFLLLPCLALGSGCADSPEREALIDLIPHARLVASDTRPYEPLPWPREAEQAIATVRDDQPDTAWQAPPAGVSDESYLRRVMEVFEGDAQTLPRYEALERAIDDLSTALDADSGLPLDQAWSVLDLAAGMSTLQGELHHSGLAAELVDELHFPLDKARHEGEAGLWFCLPPVHADLRGGMTRC